MQSTWTIEIDKNGIAWLAFDLDGEKVNKFTSCVMRQLDEVLEQLAGEKNVAALVIRSGKPHSFIVGADIEELAAIRDVQDAKNKAVMGQRVFFKLATLKIPTVAVIHGACMGGGTELALACQYRLATDDEKTAIGLPEVKLGILPGWGGTQRLPKVVGLPAALTMIMSGQTIPARKAMKMGLVDGIVASTFMNEQARRFVSKVLSHSGAKRVEKRRVHCRPLWARVMESTPPGRALIFHQAAKETLKRTKGQYPAPMEALNAVRDGYGKTIEEGLRIEAEGFAKLATTSVSRNLVWVFQASQRSKKRGVDDISSAAETSDATPIRQPRHAAVIGAGIMGGGIAWALSRHDLTVRLKDISWDAVAKGMAEAAGMYRPLVKRRKMTQSQMDMAMHRISGSIDYSGFANVDVVIEAVAENMELKKKVLAQIEAIVPQDALIATNTSSLSISEMATALKNPQRFVGLHFFNPVNRMPLVEVIPGQATSPQAVAAAVELARRLNKTSVVVGDCAGFLVNRVLLPYVNESIRMFEEGVDPQRIDRLIERFGMPMGPLTLADEVGLDVGLKVAHVLEDAFGSRMHVPLVLEKAVASGSMLGRKSGAGFYLYNNGHKKPNPKAKQRLNGVYGHMVDGKSNNARQHRGSEDHNDILDSHIIDRAILTMVNEAARCLEEKIVPDAESLDMAMLMGTGFAPFRGGLLRWADHVGTAEIAIRLERLVAVYGERFRPAPLIEKLAQDRGRFYDMNTTTTERRVTRHEYQHATI